jgi:dipeptidyl aminopeptidase/acylaminoacyl peptidase
LRTKQTLIVLTVILFSFNCIAQTNYKLPPKTIVDIVTAAPTPAASLSPGGNYMLLTESESMPSISYLSQPLLRIAGMRITPQTNSMQRTRFATAFTVKNLKSGNEVKIKLPVGVKLGNAMWSQDDKLIVFTQYTENDVKLWAADVKTGNAKVIVNGKLNMTIGNGVIWLKDNKHVMVFMIPDKRGKVPLENKVPMGPTIQENLGKVSKAPTYQDLLKNYYDEQLFDYYATSQLILVDVTTGAKKNINKPAIYSSVSYSPNGEYILVDKIKHPYSYTVTYYSFPRSVEIWNSNGEPVKQFADLPLADEVPLNGVSTGPRDISWRALEPATLTWVEALDNGDPEKEVPFRDKVLSLSAPFKNFPDEIIKTRHRYNDISWLEEKGFALLSEWDWKRRWNTTYLINVDKKDIQPKIIFDLSTQDAYSNPGSPISKITKDGETVIIYENNCVFLSGQGSSPKGDMPFLDKMNLMTMQKERLFQCKDMSYESFIDF